MIFIVRVSDSERLSNSHKIFIYVKIFDSLKIGSHPAFFGYADVKYFHNHKQISSKT